jgi:NAD(P)-dependent dehydrogenase (short-subunit alcohol dehydrogenase family)
MSGNSELKGRVVLVTGASSGIGRHFALRLAAEGAHVAAAARRVELLETLSDQVIRAGGTLVPIQMDVSSVDSIRKGVDAAEKALGTIGILVNNAGIGHQSRVTDVTEEDFDRVFSTNVKGAFFVAQECGARMIKAKIEGRIVNTASIAGLVTMPQLTAYGMSKAAVIQMTKSLAREWARQGINVNAICPGYIATELNADFFSSEIGQKLVAGLPKRRIGEASDLDGALLLLTSRSASRFITGAIITADDGYSIS